MLKINIYFGNSTIPNKIDYSTLIIKMNHAVIDRMRFNYKV